MYLTSYGMYQPKGIRPSVFQEAEATGVTTSALHARSAFDVFTASDPANVAQYAAEKDRKYKQAVQAAGDTFHPTPPTPGGTPCPGAMQLLDKITHTGDKPLPSSAHRIGRGPEAERSTGERT